jgi:hypothetical protein
VCVCVCLKLMHIMSGQVDVNFEHPSIQRENMSLYRGDYIGDIALLGVADWTTSTCFDIPATNSSEPSEPIEVTVRASASDFVVTLELTAKHWEEALSKSPVAQAIVHEYLANWKRKHDSVGECKQASKAVRLWEILFMRVKKHLKSAAKEQGSDFWSVRNIKAAGAIGKTPNLSPLDHPDGVHASEEVSFFPSAASTQDAQPTGCALETQNLALTAEQDLRASVADLTHSIHVLSKNLEDSRAEQKAGLDAFSKHLELIRAEHKATIQDIVEVLSKRIDLAFNSCNPPSASAMPCRDAQGSALSPRQMTLDTASQDYKDSFSQYVSQGRLAPRASPIHECANESKAPRRKHEETAARADRADREITDENKRAVKRSSARERSHDDHYSRYALSNDGTHENYLPLHKQLEERYSSTHADYNGSTGCDIWGGIKGTVSDIVMIKADSHHQRYDEKLSEVLRRSRPDTLDSRGRHAVTH